MIKSRSFQVLCLVIALLLSISIIGLSGGGIVEGGRGGPGYHVTWSPPTVSAAVTPGGSWEGSVSFSSSMDLVGAELSVVPELAPFVSIDPQSFPAVVAGTLYTVHFHIAVPDDAETDVACEGTILLMVGRRTYPQPLKVNIYVAAPLETMTEESYNATLALEVEAGQLYWDNEEEMGTEQARQIALEFLSQQDEVFDAGISEGGSIWIVYKDGIHAVISTSPPGTLGSGYQAWDSQVSAEALVSTSRSPIPGNRQAILLWPLCSDPLMEPWGTHETLGNVADRLEGIGYNVIAFLDDAVTVDLLKSMYSYGVVDFMAHGGLDSVNQVALETGEETTWASTLYHTFVTFDNLAHRIIRVTSQYDYDGTAVSRWAIRTSFVSHYAAEPYPNTIVIASACSSLANSSMADAFLDAGAYVYTGWTATSNIRIVLASKLRLLECLTEGMTLQEAFTTLRDENLTCCPLYGGGFLYYPSGARDYRLFHPDHEVTFACPNLEAAIREAIGKPTGDIYASDLEGLTYLDASGRSITDLTGLEHCTSLTDLHVGHNQISDISPLAGLINLTGLDLWHNQISDISPLAGLTILRYLNLGNNQISDISPLAGFTGLTWLYLLSNQISDISPLAGLTSLTYLTLGNNQISDISPLAGLTNVTSLTLSLNQISDISPLASLTNLTQLSLYDNQISDLSPLAGLASLTSLNPGDNQISDISPLAGLTSLTYLNLWSNQISDISPLARLTSLTRLDLLRNQISDVSPLAGLTNLTSLRLEHNQISDISPLAGLTNLSWLNIRSNQISDILPLVDNPGLGEGDTVYLGSNPLSSDSTNIYIPELEARGVTVYW